MFPWQYLTGWVLHLIIDSAPHKTLSYLPQALFFCCLVIWTSDDIGFLRVPGTPYFYAPALAFFCALSSINFIKIPTFPISYSYIIIVFLLFIPHFYSFFPEHASHGTTTAVSVSLILMLLIACSFFLAIDCKNRPYTYFLRISSAFALASIFSATIAFLGYFQYLPSIQEPAYIRLAGLPGNPNFLAQTLAPGFLCIIALSVMSRRHGFVRILLYLAAAVVAAAMLKTGSRGWLIATAAALYFGWISINRGFFRGAVVVLLPILLVAVALLIPPVLVEYGLLHGRFSTLESKRADIVRTLLANFSNGTLSEILFGRGNGWFSREFRSAHSSWLRFLIDYGLIGLLSLATALIVSFIKLARSFRAYPPILFIIVSVFFLSSIGALFNDGIFVGSKTDYWILMLILGFLLIKPTCQRRTPFSPE